MTKEWPKELPPFEEMEKIFFKGAFDPDGDCYIDRKTGKRYWVDILAGTAEEYSNKGLSLSDKVKDVLDRNYHFDGTYYISKETGKKYLIDIDTLKLEEVCHA